ncbi:MAG TPA: CvpA family protein, partial [Nitrospirae bacterium]|nr:CvpA family protein [Nitrospirota bacterium]
MVHWFDIFAVTFLLISAVWSCYRGFVREIFSLVSLIAGYVTASMFSGAIAPYFKIIVDQKHYQEMASF